MSDTAPFSPFSPAPPPKPMFDPENPQGERKGRKPRKAKAARHDVARKSRKPKTIVQPHTVAPGYAPGDKITAVPTRRKARVTRPIRLELATLMAFQGLGADEFKLTMQVVQALQSANKKSRLKIVAALGKVFA